MQPTRPIRLPSPPSQEATRRPSTKRAAKSRLTFYAGVVEGHYLVADLSNDGYARVADLNRRFDDLDLGFVDAAIVAIAESLGLPRVATTDRRHFDPLAATFALELLP